MLKQVFILILILLLSTLWLYVLYLFSGEDERLEFPRELADLQKLSEVLHEYSEENTPYTLLFFSSAYLFKQSFAIPGSIFLNLLSGALFGIWKGFLLCSFLSACGASACFILSKYFTYKILLRFFPLRVQYFHDMVEKNRDSLFYFLLSIRIFPMTPNWLINMVMASPVVGVNLKLFFLSVFFGLMPYNYLTVSAGSMLSDLKSIDEVISLKVGLGLGLLAIAMLGPIFLKKKKTK